MKKKKKGQSKIQQNLYQFYEELFSKKFSNSNEIFAHYLKDISVPKDRTEWRWNNQKWGQRRSGKHDL